MTISEKSPGIIVLVNLLLKNELKFINSYEKMRDNIPRIKSNKLDCAKKYMKHHVSRKNFINKLFLQSDWGCHDTGRRQFFGKFYKI